MSRDSISYDREADRLVCALKDKDADELMSALLVETRASRALITDVPAYKLEEADDALCAVEELLAGTLSDYECAEYGKALWRVIEDGPLPGDDKSGALVDYEMACAYLTTAVSDEDAAYMVCLNLTLFTRRWTGCSQAEAERKQLDRLKAVLGARSKSRRVCYEDRSRNSLLAH